MSQPSPLANLAIVLVRPKNAENIGAAARIALNMGIERILLIGEGLPERETMAKTATHNAVHLLDRIEVFTGLEHALADFSLIVGTTARRGRLRLVETNPRRLPEAIAPYLAKNRVAILFGPEDTGLTNDELKYCHMASAIPTADFSSLNLAQAVAIHCYELYYGIVCAGKELPYSPELANSHELERMYQYLEESLYFIDFLNDKSHTYWMTNLRRFFARMNLTSKDANIIRTVCKKFLLHQQRYNGTNLGEP